MVVKDAASKSKKFWSLWGPVGAKVSKLDFEPRKNREFQKSSRGVSAEALTPPAQRPKFLALSGYFFESTNITRFFNTM
ncbi:hypothetical protein JMJ99_11475 [Companilactobacillus zhachilii]|uniref:hypothetical protein n=1 Tax=Companilactobacillus zhachilii TaxID=2304606 RepID=UPI001920A660|nr:hypothetical protein [Companilactobacillus zhachilii]MBL3531992.1 hypothetical protein [Companilactobacillus zhachilii]